MNGHALTALVATLMCMACGGDGDQSGFDAGDVASDAEANGTESAGAIRFVNLWVDEGAGAAVDVYMKPLMGSESALFQNVGFGTFTAAAAIPADVWLYVYRTGEAEDGEPIGSHYLSSTDLEEANRLTLVMGYTRPLREGGLTGGFEVFHDIGDVVTGSMPVRSVDGALLVVSVSPANRILGEAREPFTFGSPGAGCLRLAGSPPPATGPGAITTSLGGTAVITYDVEPGSHPIAAYPSDTSRCAGAPRIGPVSVTVGAGGRSYLFAYATGPNDLRLLAVPPSTEP